MPKAGQKLLRGLKRAGEEVTARTPGSAKRGIYVDPEDFERIKGLVGSPMQADLPADRDALLKAFQIVNGLIDEARIEASLDPTEDEVDVLQNAADKVLERSQTASPKERAALIATISKNVDDATQDATGEQAQRVEQIKQKLADEYQKTPNDPSSGLTPGKAVQAFDDRFQSIKARRTLQLPGGSTEDASRRNPEVSTARAVEVRQSPPVPPRPGTRPDDRSGSVPTTPTFEPGAESTSPEILVDSPPPRRTPQPTPTAVQEEEESDVESVSSGESAATQPRDDLPATTSSPQEVVTSASAHPGSFPSFQGAVNSLRNLASRFQSTDQELPGDVDIGVNASVAIHESVLADTGPTDGDGSVYADALTNQSLDNAEYWQDDGEPEIAATIAVLGKARLDERIADSEPGTTANQFLLESSTRLTNWLAENVDQDSVIRHGYATDFRSLSAPEESVPTRAPQRATSLPTRRAPPASPVDAASHPHVSTAVSQHASTTGRRVPPPLRPDRAISVASAIQERQAIDAARNEKYSEQEKRNLKGMASTSRKTGTLEIGPPPRANPTNIRILTENLEQNPRVAALVQRGLLSTRDVMNPVYVRDMEKTLQKKEIMKEVEGRDPRYRPRTARQAYRPPVNVTTTGIPGIYRYQRPRFAQPEISTSTN